MRRRIIALTLVAVAGLVVAACGVPEASDYRPIGGPDVADLLATTTSSTTTTSTTLAPTTTAPPETTLPILDTSTTLPTEPVSLYFISGSQLQAVQFPLTPNPSATQVLQALVAGLDVLGPLATGLRSAVPAGATFNVSTRGGIAYVDMSTDTLTKEPTDSRFEFGQIVLTLLSNVTGIGQVSFTVDTVPQVVELGDGSQTNPGDPVAKDDYSTLVAR